MDEFIQLQIERTIRQATETAYAMLKQNNLDACSHLCNQILSRDTSAVGPHVIMMKCAMQEQKWSVAIDCAFKALRTRPQFEDQPFDIGIGVSYANIAFWIQECCWALEKETDFDLNALNNIATLSLARGLASHTLSDYDEARGHYEKILDVGEEAHWDLGQVLNLLYALEHQAGRPDLASQWIDLEKFPIELNILNLPGVLVPDGFNDDLCKEIIESPALKPWQEFQSHNWYIGTGLNKDNPASAIKTLENIFFVILEENRERFKELKNGFVHKNFKLFPDPYELNLFSAVIKGPGHVGPHVHSDSYLVGNYYAAVPDEPGLSEKTHIEYGKHLYSSATGMNYPTRKIATEVGSMLMWPAYYSHATGKTLSEGTRIAVGFDLEPQPKGGAA